MKHKRLTGLLFFLLLFLAYSHPVSAATPVGSHGRLSVKGTQLKDAKGKAFQLKGVSTHGIAWYPEYISKEAFRELRDKWGVNTIRLAMYTAEYNGYCTGGSANRKALKKQIDAGVKAATDLGMYVIIDWHILSDGNPNTHKKQAVSFFKEMARKYKKHKNVIYEICNEPNGGVSWAKIRSYAQTVIKAIRKIDKRNVILVGTPNWSQDVEIAAKSPIKKYKNIMYTLHFYANTHRESYRAKAAAAIRKGLPLFVSEFGICDASGNGGVNEKEANAWIKFLDSHRISYVAWNLSNKNETSSLISSGCRKKTGWAYGDLSASGKWLVRTYKGSLAGKTPDKPETPDIETPKPETPDSETSDSETPDNETPNTETPNPETPAVSNVCRVSVKAVNKWKSGKRYFTQYKVTIKNPAGTEADWSKVQIRFRYAVKKSDGWNGSYTCKKKTMTISPLSWNQKIPAKGEVTDIGFIVSSKKKKNRILAKNVMVQRK